MSILDKATKLDLQSMIKANKTEDVTNKYVKINKVILLELILNNFFS